MFKRSCAALALVVTALIASTVVPNLAPIQAAESQRTIWNETGLQQTSSTYWNANLDQPGDYTAPADLVGGRAYMRLDVVSKPSDMLVAPMICFWRHGASQFQEETCAAGRNHTFTSEGTYYFDLGTPSSWWQKGGAFDWTKPVSLGRIMIRDGVSGGRLLLNERCGGACYLGDDLDDHVPIKMDSRLIFVSDGATLNPPSDWRSGCPTSWSSACRGGESTPVTTQPAPPTTTPPTTTPAATTTTTTTVAPPTTVAVPAFVDAEPGVNSLQVSYSIPDAVLYQVRYRADGDKYVWGEPTTSSSQTLEGLEGGRRHTVEVRAYTGTTWDDWIGTTATPLGSGEPNPGGSTPTTTTPTTTVPVTTTPVTTTPAGAAFVTAVPAVDSLVVSYGIPGAVLFQVRWEDGNKRPEWTEPTTATNLTIDGLRTGRPVLVEVRGLTGQIWGDWISTTATPASSGQVDPDSPVVVVEGTSLLPTMRLEPSDRTIKVSWELAGATQFEVRSRPTGTGWWKARLPGDYLVHHFNLVENDVVYDVEVRAFKNGRWQAWNAGQVTPRP